MKLALVISVFAAVGVTASWFDDIPPLVPLDEKLFREARKFFEEIEKKKKAKISDLFDDDIIFPGSPLLSTTDDSFVQQSFKDGIRHLGNDEMCIAFRSLEWWTYSLIEPTEKISTKSGIRVFVDTEKQGGPLVLSMRGIMTWTELMSEIKTRLESMTPWSSETQLRVTQCYLDYAYQAATFLQVLETQACDFNSHDPSRCLMHEKIEAAYILYRTIATMLYGEKTGTIKGVKGLITADFPKTLPASFKPQCGAPEPGQCMQDYIEMYDTPINQNRGFFDSARKGWACGDSVPCAKNLKKDKERVAA